MSIEEVNICFYNALGDLFDHIPFDPILPGLLLKYAQGPKVLDIGSGAGALAVSLKDQGFDVRCIEPAEEPAKRAAGRGLVVHRTTLQNFSSDEVYNTIMAISSLIHIPKEVIDSQIKKIRSLLAPNGVFVVSFIEGSGEGFEDPTGTGRLRFFAKWSKEELDALLSAYFFLIEDHSVLVKKMGWTFLLRVYGVSS